MGPNEDLEAQTESPVCPMQDSYKDKFRCQEQQKPAAIIQVKHDEVWAKAAVTEDIQKTDSDCAHILKNQLTSLCSFIIYKQIFIYFISLELDVL